MTDQQELRGAATSSSGSALLTRLGHELRSPLSGILGLSRVMRCDLEGGAADPAAQRRQFALIEAGAVELLHTVEQVVEVIRVETAPSPAVYQVDLRTVVEEAAAARRAAADRRGRRVLVDTGARPITADVEPQAIRRVLQELLDNALAYAAGEQIRVGVRALPDGGAEVDVAQPGPPIPEEEQEAIFQPFVRGAAAVRAGTTGSGLGLYLARRLAERAGGQLSLDSAPQRGTTFVLRLPAERPA